MCVSLVYFYTVYTTLSMYMRYSAGEGPLGMAVLRSCFCNRKEGLSSRYE